MIGINEEILNKIIKINNINLDSIKNNSNRLLNSLSELESCYSGSSLKYIDNSLEHQQKNIKKIPIIISNYSNVLNDVKIGYKAQDNNITDVINYANSQFK